MKSIKIKNIITMDKQQIKEAAEKASEDYMENALIMSGPRGSYRKGFIAGADYVLKRLAEIPFNEVIEEIADYLQEKEDAL